MMNKKLNNKTEPFLFLSKSLILMISSLLLVRNASRSMLIHRSLLQPLSALNKRTFLLNTSKSIDSWPKNLRVNRCDTMVRLQPDAKVTFSGWVESLRALGPIIFMVVRDTTGRMQVSFDNSEISMHAVQSEDVS